MATAPQPGIGRAREQVATAQSMLIFDYDGRELSIAWQNVPIREQMECLKETGRPVEAFTSQASASGASSIGEVSLCVCWWLARRAHGEPALSWDEAADQWDVALIENVRVETPDTKASDPEV